MSSSADIERGGSSPPRRSPTTVYDDDVRGRDGDINHGNNLHVACLSSRVTQQDLKDKFGPFGRITKAQVMYDPHTREPRGFGFVSFETPDEASAALEALDGTEMYGRSIRVQIANRARAHTPTPGQYLGAPKRDGGPPPLPFHMRRDSDRERGYGYARVYPVLTLMRGGDPWGNPREQRGRGDRSDAFYDYRVHSYAPLPFVEVYDRYGNPLPPPPYYRNSGGSDYPPPRSMREHSPPRRGFGGGGVPSSSSARYGHRQHQNNSPRSPVGLSSNGLPHSSRGLGLPPPRSRYD